MKALVLMCVLIFATAYAETWTARGKGTDFTLKVSDDLIDYDGKTVQTEIPLRDCNREQVNSFMNSMRTQLRGPASLAKGEGIALQIDNKPTTMVDHHSHLGMQFSDMDDRIQRLKLLDDMACE